MAASTNQINRLPKMTFMLYFTIFRNKVQILAVVIVDSIAMLFFIDFRLTIND